MKVRRRFVALTVIAALAGASSTAVFASETATPVVLEVVSGKDDGQPGTLRWAIEQANKSTTPHLIRLKRTGSAPLVIQPRKALPPITTPVEIRGDWTRDSISKPQIILDGSRLVDLKPMQSYGNPLNCPGVVANTYGPNVRATANAAIRITDTGNVRLSGFEISNFCIGVLSLRSHDNVISNMRFENNLGGAAVLLSGDDGTPAGGPTEGSGRHVVEDNVFLNNSDSIDLARGDRGTILRRNWIVVDGQGLAVPSSGVEICCDAHEATIEDNYLAGFAEALQLDGDGHRIRRNVLENNAVGLGIQGKGNVAEDNVARGNRAGIFIGARGSARLSRNLTYDNGRAVSACAPGTSRAGVCHERDWETSAFNLSLNGLKGGARTGGSCGSGNADCADSLPAPQLVSATMANGLLTVRGRVDGPPNQEIVLELFSGAPLPSGEAGARLFLGALPVRTSERGNAEFIVDRLPATTIASGGAVTATATDENGRGSQLATARQIISGSEAPDL